MCQNRLTSWSLQIVSEEVNRKCRARSTIVQFSTHYTDRERHNAQHQYSIDYDVLKKSEMPYSTQPGRR